ncbi:MAG: LysE family transporter [Polyangiaceae bacterium]|nr:LysE family transporter [Polyangiaceae bacterium]
MRSEHAGARLRDVEYPRAHVRAGTAPLLAFVLGVALGFVGSIPALGPLLALVVARGLESRRGDALALAVGGAVAESGYVALAFWGFGELSARYAEFARWSGPVSGAILIVLGALMARRKARAVSTAASASSVPGHAALGFLLVALNPAFLATWSLLASALVSARLIEPASGAAPALAAGAFLGIVLWFALVASIAERQRARFDPRKVEVWVRWLGVLVILFGTWLLLAGLR